MRGWTEAERLNWLATMQLAGPAIAVTVSGIAALRSTSRERAAWLLISAGLVLHLTRVVSPSDRRARVLTIGVEGIEVMQRAKPATIRAQEQLVEALAPAEVEQLISLLRKVVDALGDVTRTSR